MCFQVYLFNDSLCVDDLKLKFYDVVVSTNVDFCVSGLTVVCFHDNNYETRYLKIMWSNIKSSSIRVPD